MKRLVSLATVLAGAAILAATSGASPKSATVLIRHQTHGCHTWSVNHGPFRPSQTVHLARGGVLTIVNNDVMPQRLIEKSGPKAREVGNPALAKMGASVKVTFAKTGTYHFATKAGEDYPGVDAPTVGKDNNLTLTVVVS